MEPVNDPTSYRGPRFPGVYGRYVDIECHSSEYRRRVKKEVPNTLIRLNKGWTDIVEFLQIKRGDVLRFEKYHGITTSQDVFIVRVTPMREIEELLSPTCNGIKSAVGMPQQSIKQDNSRFSFKCNERAERRKQKNTEAEIKQLRKSLNFKAIPLPSFIEESYYSTQKFYSNHSDVSNQSSGASRRGVIIAISLSVVALCMLSLWWSCCLSKMEETKTRISYSYNKSSLNFKYETLEKATNYFDQRKIASSYTSILAKC
ncbi:hypothetical protein C2S52_018053 [Perilla frutescens var. hirtella]|nr:hypothetical protein C2S52_018053 [Perilla frutescens var. hirtella]